MDQRLKDYDHFVKAYIDDIVIYSDTKEEHLNHLDKVFARFDEIGLAICAKKSFLGYPSITLLGFSVDGYGVSITKDRIAAIRKLQMPTNLADLETYIGMTGFLRKHIPWYQQRCYE